MAAGYCYCLGIKSNAFFLKDNKKEFILWLNVPKVTAYQLLFGYGKQRRESPISQATPHDVRLRSILGRKETLVIYQYEKFV